MSWGFAGRTGRPLDWWVGVPCPVPFLPRCSVAGEVLEQTGVWVWTG